MTDADSGHDLAPVDAHADTSDGYSVEFPPVMAEGIHFNLDETLYHADPSLGSGSIRQLAKAPIYYWQESWMNPLREASGETPALLYGRALHCLVLEGPTEFSKRYAPIPVPEDHPGCYATADDILRDLRAVDAEVRKAQGIKLTGKKDELFAALQQVKPDAVSFDSIMAEFRNTCSTNGTTAISQAVHSEIIQAAAYILGDERVRAAFQSGTPEVSLFWEHEGVPLKARLDYVRLGKANGRMVGIVTDLKSFANQLELPPERAVARAIATTRLDVQAAAYLEGIKRIPQWIADGNVYGAESVSPAWLDALSEVTEWRFFWCFYEKGLPVSLLRSTRPGSPVIDMARLVMDRALQAYRDNMSAFGTAWRFVDPIPDHEISLDDLPRWLGDQ